MDPTMLAVFVVGGTLLGAAASLAAIILSGQRALRTEIAAVETRLGKRIADTKSELRGEINAVETRLGERIARLEDRVRELAGESFGLRPSPASTPDESPA